MFILTTSKIIRRFSIKGFIDSQHLQYCMSEYYRLVNYSKEEYVDAHSVDCQAHIGGWFHEPTNAIILYLIANGRYEGGEYRGRWSRDNIELLGNSRDVDLEKYENISENVFEDMKTHISNFPKTFGNK